MQVFFCDAHSPWQRGSNENMNGLLRDYSPKGANLANITPAQLQYVADEINHRPRETLGWARPADLIADAAIASTAQVAAGDWSAPNDRGGITIHLRQQLTDTDRGRHMIVGVETQVTVTPI
nr:IS30 family transposase [Mycobacterium decipiens]